MADPNRRRNTITWSPPITTPVTRAPNPHRGTLTCNRCRTGDCHLCTRVGCYHPCPDMRSAGVTATSTGPEHGAPGPGRKG